MWFEMRWLLASIAMLICLAMMGIVSCADEKLDANISEKYTYTFIQEGPSGSFVKDNSGNYTLTITEVIPYTVAFSDRPARDASFIEMDEFISGFNFDPLNPPNAVILLKDANETADAIVVELTAPEYHAANKTIKYSAKVTHAFEFKSMWAEDISQKADPAIPEKLGQVILVIDDCPCVPYPGCTPCLLHDSCFKPIAPYCFPTCGRCCC
jgi:hypothetical protein